MSRLEQAVEAASAELERQYRDPDSDVGHYTTQRNADGSLNYVAIDGNPCLRGLVQAIATSLGVNLEST